jgi:hypothetical protein
MNIKVRRIKLENRYSNVRTVRCDTLVVCKQVIKSKSGGNVTLDSGEVIENELLCQLENVLKRG